uniref:Uncharacterized protein n=1 Tax=Arion vulgaris TaxID=1028688 RepID=A0A0B6ZF63_9EUPU
MCSVEARLRSNLKSWYFIASDLSTTSEHKITVGVWSICAQMHKLYSTGKDSQ